MCIAHASKQPAVSLLHVIAAGMLALVAGLPLAAGDDAAWLRGGTLLFEDSFDREEDGNLAKAIGNGWNSATADRVPDVKQADLDGGVLKVIDEPRAGHQPHIHHEAGFEDGGAIFRFRLPKAGKPASLMTGFVDRQTRAGHDLPRDARQRHPGPDTGRSAPRGRGRARRGRSGAQHLA